MTGPEPYRGSNAALARNSGPSAEDAEPIIVSSLRRNPRGEVRYMPNAPETTAMLGTSARGFLSEYDYAIAAAEARGAERGARAVTSDAAVEAATRAVWDHFYGGGQVRRYGIKDWPPPEQHMPWWRGIAEAALTAAREAATRVGADRPYCLRCEVPIYRDEQGVWRREATGVADCPRNPARDGHEPLARVEGGA